MAKFVSATVEKILNERKGMQRVQVSRHDGGDGDKAYCLTNELGRVDVGDTVILNVTAVELSLGTGGWHIIHWNMKNKFYNSGSSGDIMKLRYTSLQSNFELFVPSEERQEIGQGVSNVDLSVDSYTLDKQIPAVGCLVLSQVPAVALAMHEYFSSNLLSDFSLSPCRISLIITDGSALPLAGSDLIFEIKQMGLITEIVTTGNSYGGDFEEVSVASAILHAYQRGANAVIISQSYGVTGTNSKYGFSGIDLAWHFQQAKHVNAVPIFALRYSLADPRKRHQGISHHTKTVLELCPKDVVIPVPEDMDTNDSDFENFDKQSIELYKLSDIVELIERFGISVTTMGRLPKEDEQYFRFAAAAGVAAAKRIVV